MEHLRLRLHFSFYLALIAYLVMGQAVQFGCYVVAMVLHECAHFWVARRLFYKCSQIELSCFGAVLYGDFNYATNRDATLIALAGPAFNLILALFCVSFWWIFPQSYYFTCNFVWANVGMALVNLLPVYPLDGSKVFCALLQQFFAQKDTNKLVKKFNVILATILVAIFVFALILGCFLPSLCLFALFVFSSSFSRGQTVYLRRSFLENYSKRMVKGVEKKTLVFDTEVTVANVAKRMLGGSLYDVELWHDGKLVKRFSFYQLDKILKTANPNDKIISVVGNL